MFKFLDITTLKPNHAKNSTPLPNGSQLTRNESTKINFASNKCQGQNKDTIMRQLDLTNKELIDEQKLNDFIVWIMHDASCAWDQLEIQRPQLVLSKLTGCAFQTFFYSIQ